MEGLCLLAMFLICGDSMHNLSLSFLVDIVAQTVLEWDLHVCVFNYDQEAGVACQRPTPSVTRTLFDV